MTTPNDTSQEEQKDNGEQPVTVSSLPAKSEPSVPPTSARKPDGPMTARDVQEMAFKMAGTNRGEVATKIVKKLVDKMDATKTHVALDRDGNVHQTVVEDNSTQLGATKQASEIVGLLSSRSDGGGGKASVTIELVLPTWAQVKEVK